MSVKAIYATREKINKAIQDALAELEQETGLTVKNIEPYFANVGTIHDPNRKHRYVTCVLKFEY